MGNSIGGRKKARVMKIDGTIFKLRTPVRSMEVVQDYPGHVLLESEAVKQLGIRAKPLQPHQELKPKKIYFLVELPTLPPEEKGHHRRARSVVNMTAKDRLECLMLSRRSVSDLALVKSTGGRFGTSAGLGPGGATTVKLRLPKAEVSKLMEESKDEDEAAEKIVHFYMKNTSWLVN